MPLPDALPVCRFARVRKEEIMTFGSLVRECRTVRGLTLMDVAGDVGVSVPYLSRIERDREKPPPDALIRRIARTIGIPEDEAFAAARRLPPDLQDQAREVVAVYRRFSR
jgi:HTH-type transcriptional regulator, competence development regulator